MSVYNYRQEIRRMENELKKWQKLCQAEVVQYPAGSLWLDQRATRNYYFHSHKDGDRYVRESANNDEKLMRALARKALLQKTLKSVDRNLYVLGQTIERMEDVDLNMTIQSLPKAYRSLPEDYFFGADGDAVHQIVLTLQAEGLTEEEALSRASAIRRHADWAEESFWGVTPTEETHGHTTSRGLPVRSKSELLICEQLYSYGVPFRYEAFLQVEDHVVAPDFTFLDWRDHPFYLEHAGMMDVPDYQARHYRKMEEYFRAGIVFGRDLLVSYDRDGEISMEMVRSLVRNEILPRL